MFTYFTLLVSLVFAQLLAWPELGMPGQDRHNFPVRHPCCCCQYERCEVWDSVRSSPRGSCSSPLLISWFLPFSWRKVVSVPWCGWVIHSLAHQNLVVWVWVRCARAPRQMLCFAPCCHLTSELPGEEAILAAWILGCFKAREQGTTKWELTS